MKRHRRIQEALLIVLQAALVSCATPDSGYKISDETVAFVRPGVTTRSDIQENLGPPLLELKDLRVVAYSWGKMRATGAKAGTVRQEDMREQQMASTLNNPADEPGLVESRRWIYCIALDANDRVTRVQKIKLEGAGSLEQSVRAWARSQAPP